MDQLNKRESFLAGVGKLLLVTVITTASATATAAWTVRGMVADVETRMTKVETKQDIGDTNVMARLDSMQQDMRELRQLFIDSKARP